MKKSATESYRKEFDKIKALDNNQQRGAEFEKLFNKICEDANISVFPRFRTVDTSQEIDGACGFNLFKSFSVRSEMGK